MPVRPTQNVQETLWSIADAMARHLKAPSQESMGDPRWTVSGVTDSTWEVNHPDMEPLEGGSTPLKVMIKRLDTEGKSWAIIARNLATKPEANSVVYRSDSGPPNPKWDVEQIAQAAAAWFQEQKDEIVGQKEDLTPSLSPGSVQPQQEMGPGGMPMASIEAGRSARLARRLR